MAQIEDLLLQASEIRDAEQDKENTALRVGQALVDIIQHIANLVSVEALSAALADYAPLVGNLVDWRCSRIVPLYSMGLALDNVDGGDWSPNTIPVGAIVYATSGGHVLKYKKDAGTPEVYPCIPNIIYINLHSKRLYTFNATDGMVELSAEPVQRRVINDMNVTNANQLNVGEVGYVPLLHKVRYKYAANGSIDFPIDPNAIYCDASSNTTIRWDENTEEWVVVGSNSGSGEISYTEDSETIYVTCGGYEDLTPRISVQPTEINLSPAVGGTATKTIVVKGFNLTSPIVITLNDTSGYYSIDRQTLLATGGNLVLTYHPTQAGNHNASLLISSGSDADVAVGIKGVAAAPTINVDNQSLTLRGVSGEEATASFHVSGISLADVINVSVVGNGFSATPSVISVSQATNGIDVVVKFDGSADSGTATITLASTGASSVQVTAEYTAISRLPVGSTITSYAGFVFTVLEGQESVSVRGSGSSGAVVIPSSVVDENGLGYDVTAIEYQAFRGMNAITSVEIPSSITTWLGGSGGWASYSQAFNSCTGLVSAIINSTAIGREAFNGCSHLANVTITDDLTSIGESAFKSCTSLVQIIIPNGVEIIGNECFSGCSSLKRVQIGTSSLCQCNTFGSAFFSASSTNNTANGALNLEYIICYASNVPSALLYSRMQYGGGFPNGFRNYDSSTPFTGTNININGSGRVYVPRASLNNYRTNQKSYDGSYANPFLHMNDINDSTGASGRIYAIEDIGTISGYENDELLTE